MSEPKKNSVTSLVAKWIQQQEEHPEWTPDLEDLVYMCHGTGSDRDRVFSLLAIAAFIADGKISPFKTDEIDVGTSVWKNVAGVGPSIANLYSLAAGIIEAAVKFKVGGSEWIPGNNKPSISGLYSLAAGNVDSANVKVDTLTAHTSGETRIAVEAMLVKNKTQTAEKLDLGPTKVNGDANVTGNLDVLGKVTMGKMGAGSLVITITDSTSEAEAEQAVSDMEDGLAFIILNTSTSALSFNFSGGAVVSIAAKKGVWGIKAGGYAYPLNV